MATQKFALLALQRKLSIARHQIESKMEIIESKKKLEKINDFYGTTNPHILKKTRKTFTSIKKKFTNF